MPIQHDHPVAGHNFQEQANLLTLKGQRQLEALDQKFGLPSPPPRRRGLTRRLYNLKLDHKLAIRDAAIALEVACRAHGWTFSHWLDDADFRAAQQRGQIKMANQPDGFFVAAAAHRRCPLLLELDRTREQPESWRAPETAWRHRVEAYGEYLRNRCLTDRFWRRLGLEPLAMERPLVLTITEDDAHVAKLLEATRAAGGRGAYWHASWREITASGILAPIWRVTISERRRSLREHFLGPETNPTAAPAFDHGLGQLLGDELPDGPTLG